MNNFLRSCVKAHHNLLSNPEYYEKVHVILGNESCDLDSAVCSLVYGYIMFHEMKQRGLRNVEMLPLLNIPHEDLPLKTEVTYYFRLHGVAIDLLPTRGSLNLVKMHRCGVLQLTLVDHHTLPPYDQELIPSVVEVIDHRPQEPGWDWSGIPLTMNRVGSCASLITQKILQRSPHLLTFQICNLLYGPIVLDTFNFSPDAGRAQQLDREMVNSLDKKIAVDREKLFHDLVIAKTDIESLTDLQIIRKDLKMIANVPVAGLPMLAEEFLRRPNAEISLTTFCKIKSALHVVILMGVKIVGETVEKDVAVFALSSDVEDYFANGLERVNDFGLKTKHVYPHAKLLRQSNIKKSRKQIGPIVGSLAQRYIKVQESSKPQNFGLSVKAL